MGPKNRFTSLDTCIMVSEVASAAEGLRLTNAYSISDKMYLMKFSIPESERKTEGESKVNVLLESGIRFHCTRYDREKSDMPSNFTMKLRKHLRSKRLESVSQLGVDRIVDFRFGIGDSAFHLIVELYNQGNVVLTDHSYGVLALLRSHQFDKDVVLKVGEPYPVSYTTKGGCDDDVEMTGALAMNVDAFLDYAKLKEQEHIDWHKGPANEKSKRKLKAQYIKQLLLQGDSGVSHYSGEIIEHCILTSGFQYSSIVDELHTCPREQVEHLLQSLHDSWGLTRNARGATPVGYIIRGRADNSYVEFTPMILKQHEDKRDLIDEFTSFGEAVDEFYAKKETQMMERALLDAEKSALAKVEKVREARENHIESLVSKQESMELSARLAEYFANDIDKVRLVLNSALENGMEWGAIQEMVASETANGNPVAALIAGLDLKNNRVSLRLRNIFAYGDDDNDEDEDEEDFATLFGDSEDEEGEQTELKRRGLKVSGKSSDEETPSDLYCIVSIDITKSAYANARELYSDRKLAVTKEKKAVDASYSAMTAVERQVEKKLAAQKQKVALQSIRRTHWFEKFNWFITSEGYLVISGRDAAQCEQIVMRYMRPGDIFVHADTKGASPCILRYRSNDYIKSDDLSNADDGRPDSSNSGKVKRSISPLAIHEAANFCVCRSASWSSKIMSSGWWVWGSQITPSRAGDYARLGRFLHEGGKTLLPPMTMEMGFGILFCLDEESALRHANERRDRSGDQALDELTSVMSEAASKYGLPEPTESVLMPPTPPLHARPELKPSLSSSNSSILQENAHDAGLEDRDEGKGKSYSHASERSETTATGISQGKAKHKKLSKKKARRYAEQDDEDRELAMAALGHGAPGSKLKDKLEEKKKAAEAEERRLRAEKAGVAQFMHEQEQVTMRAISDSIRDQVESLVKREVLISVDDVSSECLAMLSTFTEEEAAEILSLLEAGLKEKKDDKHMCNVSGFLSGIMRRFSKHKDGDKNHAGASKSIGDQDTVKDEDEEEEDVEETDRGDLDSDLADGISCLTYAPRDGDTVLYALPFCGPYSSMREFKYRAKLLPGALKKSKALKTCMDLFVRLPQCKGQERVAMESMKEADSIALLLADTRVSVPGLQQLKQATKASSQGKKKLQRGQSKKS